MQHSPICYNINGPQVRDKARLLAHLQRLQPAWVLVMDSLPLAVEINNLLPGCNVIYRIYPDDGTPTSDPVAWVRARKMIVGNNALWCYTTNEPPFTSALIDWHTRAMREAIAVGLRLCVLNMSCGQPEQNDWPLAHEVLALCAARPDLFVLGLHEGGCGVMWSGTPNFQQRITPITAWPQDLRGQACYHSGRYQWIVAYCRDNAMRPPRIVMTEYAMDVLNDIADWHQTLKRTPPYFDLRGWKTHAAQWADWWPQWSAEEAYFQQLAHMWRALYAGGPVEALLLFTWSAAWDWRQHDVSEAFTLQAKLEEANLMAIIDVNPGVDDARWIPYIAWATGSLPSMIRQNPTTTSVAVGSLAPGQNHDVHHIPFDALTDAEKARAQQPDYRWHIIKNGANVVGWMRGDVVTLVPKPITPPAPKPEPGPEPKPTDPDPNAPPVPDDDHGPAYNALRLKIIELEERIVEMERELTALIAKEIAASESSLLTDAARHFVAFIDARQRAHDLKKVS